MNTDSHTFRPRVSFAPKNSPWLRRSRSRQQRRRQCSRPVSSGIALHALQGVAGSVGRVNAADPARGRQSQPASPSELPRGAAHQELLGRCRLLGAVRLPSLAVVLGVPDIEIPRPVVRSSRVASRLAWPRSRCRTSARRATSARRPRNDSADRAHDRCARPFC